MAKNDIEKDSGLEDLDDFDLDFDFGEEDMGDPRSPLEKMQSSAFEVLKDVDQQKKIGTVLARNALPREMQPIASAVDTAVDMADRIKKEAEDKLKGPIKDMRKTLADLGDAGGGEGFYKHLSNLRPKDDDFGDATTQMSEEDIALSQINEIFASQAKTQTQQQKIARDEQAGIAKNQATLFGRLIDIGNMQLQYQNNIDMQYKRKDLELQQRQFFALRDILRLTAAGADDTKDKLAGILKNTGLPDIVKTRGSEVFKELGFQRLYGSVHDSIGDVVGNFGGRLQETVMNKASGFVDSLKEGLAAGNEIVGEVANSGGDPAEMAGMIGADIASENMAYQLGIFIRNQLGKNAKIDKLARTTEYMSTNAPLEMQNAIRNWDGRILNRKGGREGKEDNKIQGLINSFIGGSLKGMVDDTLTSLLNEAADVRMDVKTSLVTGDATTPVPWDNLSRKTTVEIIPGYLSRILEQLRISNGFMGRVVYDPTRETFTTLNEAVANAQAFMTTGADLNSDRSRTQQTKQAVEQELGAVDPNMSFSMEDSTALINAINELNKNKRQLTTDNLIKSLERNGAEGTADRYRLKMAMTATSERKINTALQRAAAKFSNEDRTIALTRQMLQELGVWPKVSKREDLFNVFVQWLDYKSRRPELISIGTLPNDLQAMGIPSELQSEIAKIITSIRVEPDMVRNIISDYRVRVSEELKTARERMVTLAQSGAADILNRTEVVDSRKTDDQFEGIRRPTIMGGEEPSNVTNNINVDNDFANALADKLKDLDFKLDMDTYLGASQITVDGQQAFPVTIIGGWENEDDPSLSLLEHIGTSINEGFKSVVDILSNGIKFGSSDGGTGPHIAETLTSAGDKAKSVMANAFESAKGIYTNREVYKATAKEKAEGYKSTIREKAEGYKETLSDELDKRLAEVDDLYNRRGELKENTAAKIDEILAEIENDPRYQKYKGMVDENIDALHERANRYMEELDTPQVKELRERIRGRYSKYSKRLDGIKEKFSGMSTESAIEDVNKLVDELKNRGSNINLDETLENLRTSGSTMYGDAKAKLGEGYERVKGIDSEEVSSIIGVMRASIEERYNKEIGRLQAQIETLKQRMPQGRNVNDAPSEEEILEQVAQLPEEEQPAAIRELTLLGWLGDTARLAGRGVGLGFRVGRGLLKANYNIGMFGLRTGWGAAKLGGRLAKGIIRPMGMGAAYTAQGVGAGIRGMSNLTSGLLGGAGSAMSGAGQWLTDRDNWLAQGLGYGLRGMGGVAQMSGAVNKGVGKVAAAPFSAASNILKFLFRKRKIDNASIQAAVDESPEESKGTNKLLAGVLNGIYGLWDRQDSADDEDNPPVNSLAWIRKQREARKAKKAQPTEKDMKESKEGFSLGGLFRVVGPLIGTVVNSIVGLGSSITNTLTGLVGKILTAITVSKAASTAGDIAGDVADVAGDMGGKRGKGGLLRRAGGLIKNGAKGAMRWGARLLPAAAGMASTEAIAAGAATAGSAIAGTAGSLASGAAALATNPIGWGILAAAAVGYVGYKIYKHYSKKEPVEATGFKELRMVSYGISPKDLEAIGLIDKMESELITKIAKSRTPKLTITPPDAVEDYAEDWGVDTNSAAAVKSWALWFAQRFAPVFILYANAAKDLNINMLSVDTLIKDEQKADMLHSIKLPRGQYDPWMRNLSPRFGQQAYGSKEEFTLLYNTMERDFTDEQHERYIEVQKAENSRKPITSTSPKPTIDKNPLRHPEEETLPKTMPRVPNIPNAPAVIPEENKREVVPSKVPPVIIKSSGMPRRARGRIRLLKPTNGPIVSPFGVRTHPVTGKKAMHKGVDFAAPNGTPIIAAADGIVVRRQYSESYGNVIYINHPSGYATRYAHMAHFSPEVHMGDVVRAGTVIGYVGNTGKSSGNHLHFELRKGTAYNATAVNPVSYFVDRSIAQELKDNEKAAKDDMTGKPDTTMGGYNTLGNTRLNQKTLDEVRKSVAANDKAGSEREDRYAKQNLESMAKMTTAIGAFNKDSASMVKHLSNIDDNFETLIDLTRQVIAATKASAKSSSNKTSIKPQPQAVRPALSMKADE